MTGALCPCRPAGGKSNHAGVLPGRSDIRRNSRSPFPLSNGRQWDGVHYSHHQTHERHDLDQISHGQAWVADPVRHLRVHLAASNDPSIMFKRNSCTCLMSISNLQGFYWCLYCLTKQKIHLLSVLPAKYFWRSHISLNFITSLKVIYPAFLPFYLVTFVCVFQCCFF